MTRMHLCFWLCVSVAVSPALRGSSPEELLAQIRSHVAASLKQLPNYTCVETTERSERETSQTFQRIDRLRLEVALVGGKELFAWPGDGSFEDRKLTEMVPPGAIGSGSFGLHVTSLFAAQGPVFSYSGEEVRNGVRTVRFDYRVPRMSSVYRISVPPYQETVAYHGSFWADAKALDLVRLEVRADDIPASLQLADVTESIEYGRTRIGNSAFLLPNSSELSMVDSSRWEKRNRVEFSDCRQFVTESSLSFGDTLPRSSLSAPRSLPRIELPSGLLLEMALEGEIDSETSFVGDAVKARLTKQLKTGGLIVPKGAIVSGRITRLERHPGRDSFFVIGVQFSTLEFGRTRAVFKASLVDLGPSMVVIAATGRSTVIAGPPISSEGVFQISATDRLWLPAGFHMRWKTQAPAGKTL